MTEKRFCFVYSDGVKYLTDNGKVMPDNIALNVLNELNDENKQLKRQIGNLEHTRDFCADVCADCNRLEKENEELKTFLEAMREELSLADRDNTALEKENEELKQDCKNYVWYKQVKTLTNENEELRLYNREMVKDIKNLEERNDKQAKQLDRLYKLIEDEDWRALSDIIDDFQRCEEQLQKERR